MHIDMQPILQCLIPVPAIRGPTLTQHCLLCSIYGAGMQTPFSVMYGTEQLPVLSVNELAGAVSTYDYVNGDGVVPAVSAAAGERTRMNYQTLQAYHRWKYSPRPSLVIVHF